MIVPLKPQHSNIVAQLHLKYLRSNFVGKPGLRLLQANYQTIATGMGACGFVAETDSGQPVGYICGVWDPDQVRNDLIRMYWTQLVLWGTIQVIYRPNLFMSFLQKMRFTISNANQKFDGYELRPIVVAPTVRGTGIALDLVRRLLEDAWQRNFQSVFLLTESDNQVANAFYQKARFRLTGSVIQGTVLYNRYECSELRAI